MTLASTPNSAAVDSQSMSNVDDFDAIKPEHATHIEGSLKDQEQEGLVSISEAENKRLRRKIHARYVRSLR